MSELEKLQEKHISTEEIFDGEVLHVIKDSVSLPNGKEASREVIRHIGAVCIVPITEDGKVILERQFRYPVDMVITEIPAGKLDASTEDRLEAAKRELKEETGYTADSWTDMGIYYPAAAYSDEKITMYLAQGLHKGVQELDEDEFLHIIELPIEEAVSDIINGVIKDGKTQAAILKAYHLIRR